VDGVVGEGETLRMAVGPSRGGAAEPGRDGAPVGPIRRESWERPTVIVAGEFRSAVG